MSFFLSYPKKPDPDENSRITFIESKKKVFLEKSSRTSEPTVPLSPLPFSNEFFFELLKKAGAGSG
jgi:hypothetical protein